MFERFECQLLESDAVDDVEVAERATAAAIPMIDAHVGAVRAVPLHDEVWVGVGEEPDDADHRDIEYGVESTVAAPGALPVSLDPFRHQIDDAEMLVENHV